MKTIIGTKICKHICATLSLVMLCGVPYAETAYSAEAEHKTQQTDEVKPTAFDVSNDTNKLVEANDLTALKTLGKIGDQLCEILEKASDDELIPVSIWIADIDFEEVERKVEEEVGLSRNILEQKADALRNDFVTSFSARLYSADTMTTVSDNDFITAFKDYKELNKTEVERFDDDVQSYTNVQRNTARDMLVKSNADFVDSFLGDAKDVCAYEYFPIIDCSITKEKILYLVTLNCVESISLNSNEDNVCPDRMITCVDQNLNETANMSISSVTASESDVAHAIKMNLEAVNGYYPRDNLGFDGGQIKIGQIDVGVPDKTVAQLKTATIESHGSTNVQDHPTLVASIMVGKDGMAPGAKLYNVDFDGTTASLVKCAQTLIKDGVNIINMSARIIEDERTTAKNIADYVVYQYNITWVCAAGNYDTWDYYNVACPATAHNVISVGNVDTKADLNPSNDVIWHTSCYKTSSGNSWKPEVVAPGCKYYYTSSSEYKNGTSFAAPVVAGLAAQLMSFSSELVWKPEAIKAAIIASCDHKTPDITSSDYLNAYLSNKEGAGVVDALKAANSLSLMKLQNTYYNTSSYPIQHTLYPITDGTKSVAISWPKKATGNLSNYTAINGNISLVDFDLYVTNSNAGSYLSKSSTNGYEYVYFNASKSNAYNVEIKRVGSSGTTERIALAINR